MLKRDEGLSLRFAPDPARGTVIGYGRNVTEHPWFPGEITYFAKKYGPAWVTRIAQNGIDVNDADLFLLNDITWLEGKLVRYVWFTALDEVRQAVVVMMAYEMGLEGLLHFPHMLSALTQKNWLAAKQQGLDSEWARDRGTAARAAREMGMILSGTWPV